MLNNLRIRNFRMLEDLEISKLGRVNLIVGKNNSGKSTILEALRLYAGKAMPVLLSDILDNHDESTNRDNTASQNWYGLANLFTGREFPSNDNTFISIESDGKCLLKIENIFYYINEQLETQIAQNGIELNIPRSHIITVDQSTALLRKDEFDLIPAIRFTLESGSKSVLDLSDASKRMGLPISWQMQSTFKPSYSYVPTNIKEPEILAELWDDITQSANEPIMLEFLKIIDENIIGLSFVKGSTPNKRVAKIKLKNIETPISMKSMGDGISRLLQIVLSIFPAKNGILLIDEFENGLHFSVQEQVWNLIFKLAKELNIQVFATTHSWDCIESFTKVAVESPQEGVLLKVSKSARTSHNGKSIVTIYDEEALKTITATDLEVR